jgi:hypothetical protein
MPSVCVGTGDAVTGNDAGDVCFCNVAIPALSTTLSLATESSHEMRASATSVKRL